MKNYLLPLITTSTFFLLGSCISKDNFTEIKSISQKDLEKGISENIQVVKIKGKDKKGLSSECTGIFAGKQTIITLAFCVDNTEVTVHGIKPTSIYVSPDFQKSHQSRVSRNALLSIDNLAVLTFEDKIPQPLLIANEHGNELTDMLKQSHSYYFFQMARKDSDISGIQKNHAEPIKSASYFFPEQIMKSSEHHFTVESEQIINFDAKLGDAGAPLIHVEGDRIRVVGLGAIISESKGYSWPEQFIAMPIDFNNKNTRLVAGNIAKKIGATFEYLSK